jgi:hypothetical protein
MKVTEPIAEYVQSDFEHIDRGKTNVMWSLSTWYFWYNRVEFAYAKFTWTGRHLIYVNWPAP